MNRLVLVALVFVLWSAAGSAVPQQRVEPPILSVRTDLVTLSVAVIDSHGAFVTGLRSEHFTVYDNGERQTILFFTGEAVPATIGLLIDSSGSMRGRRDEVTTAASAFAAMGDPADEFFTLNFNEAVWPGLPPDVAFTADVDQLRAALAAAPAQGLTALYDALDRGLTHLHRGTRDRRALIVISDGGDNASAHSLDDVLERAHQISAAIYSVTIFDPDNRDARPNVLKTLARETGGHAYASKRTDDVIRSFTEIEEEIRSGYTLGFAPAETDQAGFRSLRVVVDAGDRRQLIARTRAGYYAVPATATAR